MKSECTKQACILYSQLVSIPHGSLLLLLQLSSSLCAFLFLLSALHTIDHVTHLLPARSLQHTEDQSYLDERRHDSSFFSFTLQAKFHFCKCTSYSHKSISTKEISTFNPTTSYPGQHITSTPSNTQHASLLGSKTWQQIKSQIHLTQHIWTIVSSADEQLNSNNKHKNTSHMLIN